MVKSGLLTAQTGKVINHNDISKNSNLRTGIHDCSLYRASDNGFDTTLWVTIVSALLSLEQILTGHSDSIFPTLNS
jgi:hypothetical protein